MTRLQRGYSLDSGSGGVGGPEACSLPRGVCVISIDTELAWGAAHRRDGSGPRHRFEAERDAIARILDVFARYDVSATWAVVGHLFLDGCPRDAEGCAHPELLRPSYEWLEDDWYGIDPCSDLDTDPYYYGRDIVETVRSCPVHQEIGSHSFSHVIADDPGCPVDVFASELVACRKAAVDQGVDLRSFVYPRNAIAHLDTLVAHGFTCFRGGRTSAPFARQQELRRRVSTRVDRLWPLRGSAVWPAVNESGLVNVPQTYLFAPDQRGRRLPPTVWARSPVARLRQAARQRSLFHLWFHPYNVTAAPDRALRALEVVCQAAARERDRGRLDVLTMAETAALCRC